MHKVKYNTNIYKLDRLIKDVFEIENLETLHENYTYEKGLCTNEDNSNSIYHKRFYDKIRNGWPEFIDLYEDLIHEEVTKLISEKFIFQTTPTLRVHLVNNWATPEFHCDSQEGYNHPEGEINFLLPLTNCYSTNTLWVESEPMKGDYAPVVMSYGDLIMWNGNKLRHGNKINTTKESRVSFDFRILPLSKYNPEKHKVCTGTRKLKFEIGSYYKELR